MRTRRRDLLLVPAAMLALTLPVAADPAAPAQLESDLREEIEVKLVSVDLRALGRGGDPVGDLGADEIVVSLGGRELEVAYLERVRPEPSREGVSIELAVATNAPSAALPLEGASGGRRILVLFDLLSILERDLPAIRRNVARWVVDDAAEGDLVGFATAEADLRLRVPPTSRRGAMLAALSEDANFERPENDRLPGVFRDIQMDRVFRPVTRGTGSYLFDDRRCESLAIASLESIRTAIDMLSPLSGRKELIYVSEGFSLACQDASLQDEVRFDLETPYRDDEENDPRYRYPVEKGKMRYRVDKSVMHSGIRGALDRVLAAAARARTTIVTIHPVSGGGRAAYQSPSLNAISRHTGGVHLPGGSVRRALARAREAGAGHYELGYYLPEDVAGSAPREVEFSSTRRRVRLHASRGRSGDPPLRQWEDNALRFGEPRLVDLGEASATWSVPFVVDPSEFRFVPAGEGRERTRFTLALGVVDERGLSLGEAAFVGWLERAVGEEARAPSRYVAKVSAPRGRLAIRGRLNEPDGGAICRREASLDPRQSEVPGR